MSRNNITSHFLSSIFVLCVRGKVILHPNWWIRSTHHIGDLKSCVPSKLFSPVKILSFEIRILIGFVSYALQGMLPGSPWTVRMTSPVFFVFYLLLFPADFRRNSYSIRIFLHFHMNIFRLFPENHAAFLHRLLHIDQALVCGTPEQKIDLF